MKSFLDSCGLRYKLDFGDNIKTQHVLSSQDVDLLKEYVSGYELLAIDEVQKIPNIGVNLKILVDQVPNLKIVVTGSSSFELAGRKITLTLYPVMQLELLDLYNEYAIKEKISGWYPEIISTPDKKTK